MIEEIRKNTETAICALYQNREQEAVRLVAELLQEYQKLIREMLVEWKDERALIFLERLKMLVEQYQALDMLGMADCMEEFAQLMISFYEQEAVRLVAELLQEYQKLIREMLVEWKDERALIFLERLKMLVEQYQALDMLGMADCMEEFAQLMISFYEEECRSRQM